MDGPKKVKGTAFALIWTLEDGELLSVKVGGHSVESCDKNTKFSTLWSPKFGPYIFFHDPVGDGKDKHFS